MHIWHPSPWQAADTTVKAAAALSHTYRILWDTYITTRSLPFGRLNFTNTCTCQFRKRRRRRRKKKKKELTWPLSQWLVWSTHSWIEKIQFLGIKMQRQQHKSPAHQLSYRLRSLADVLDCMNITPSHAADTIVKAAAVLSQIQHAVRHTATHSLPFGRLTFAKTCTCQLFLLPGEHRRWVPTHRLRDILFYVCGPRRAQIDHPVYLWVLP